MTIRLYRKKLWGSAGRTGRLRADFQLARIALLGLILGLSSGCQTVSQTWYAETGPLYDFGGDDADNSDLPWLIEVGAQCGPCKCSVVHISSVLAGWPDRNTTDFYRLTGLSTRCGIGPGR